MRPGLPRLYLPSLLLLAVACDGAGDVTRTGGGDPAVEAAGYIAAVRLAGATVAYHGGAFPSGQAGPTIRVASHDTVITGGSARIEVEADQPLAALALQVQGLPGWWEVALPPGSRESALDPILQISQQAPAGGFTLSVSGSDGVVFGGSVERELSVLGVGTGELQINVSWGARSADVDLHVIEPSGEEIFFSNRLSNTDGLLDLDSNSNCDIDDINNENITWAAGTAPSGTYTVRVNLWDSCGQNGADEMNNPNGEIETEVTVMIDGVETATGSLVLSGPGNNGGLGAGTDVLQFTF